MGRPIVPCYGKTECHFHDLCIADVIFKQEGQHPLTGQRAANFRLLANQ